MHPQKHDSKFALILITDSEPKYCLRKIGYSEVRDPGISEGVCYAASKRDYRVSGKALPPQGSHPQLQQNISD
jgi:hypothetical protein